MREYEEETGKKAIWRGKVTKAYKKWKKGEKIYDVDKKLIGVLVSEEIKESWENFAEKNNFPTFSKFLRVAVNSYIEFISKEKKIRDTSKITHDLKEPLTSIQGFLHLIIENDEEDLKPETLATLKEIYTQSLYLENKINQISSESETDSTKYDILIIEDDTYTSTVLTKFFEKKGYSCISALTGLEGIEKLKVFFPKIVLLDIILPDLSGYEVCKKIKNNENYKDIPVFYITAIPESEVSKKIEETGAEGFFLKPFKFAKFETLTNYL
ncbi:MAG: response regulator [Candidatus Lokiarchaeota archaeon]